MTTVSLPPGRTVAEQRQINDQIIDACGMGNSECQAEMGYISITPPPPSQEDMWLEGTIGAGVAVVLGILWLSAKVWAGLWGARAGFRHITR